MHNKHNVLYGILQHAILNKYKGMLEHKKKEQYMQTFLQSAVGCAGSGVMLHKPKCGISEPA